MRVLVLGSGGREHALVWKLASSPSIEALLVAPGNPGAASLATAVAIDPSDPQAVLALARRERIGLVVVGPEAPLVAGVADALRADGVLVFGPDAGAAKIEGSKAFAKEIMLAAGVPTPRAEVFDDLAAATARALTSGPVVVKADGLAAGKGVIVADSGEEAAAAVQALGRLPAGRMVLLEERIEGPELSVMALCDGERSVLLPASQDHKRLLDGDRGPNTGGMGAYAPAALLDEAALERVRLTVIQPTLAALAARGTPFRGALYAGLMLTAQGVRVLEFNARLGDPETQVLMLQTASDLLPVFVQCARGELTTQRLDVHPGASVGIVLAAPGYPEAPVTGGVISGLDGPMDDGVTVFHAGTRRVGTQVVTSGGRVLTVCAHASTIEQARSLALAQAGKLHFDGRQYRHDIAAQAGPPR